MGAFENMVEAKSLQEMRNRLCLLVAKHKLMEGGNAKRVGSSMSTFSEFSLDASRCSDFFESSNKNKGTIYYRTLCHFIHLYDMSLYTTL